MPLLNGALENFVSWATKISHLRCWPVAEPVAGRMEKFRAEGELPGDIHLQVRRTVQRTHAPGARIVPIRSTWPANHIWKNLRGQVWCSRCELGQLALRKKYFTTVLTPAL